MMNFAQAMIYKFLLDRWRYTPNLLGQWHTDFCSSNDIWIFAWAIIYEFCPSNDSLGFWWSHIYIYIYTGRAGRPPSLGGISLHIIIVIIVVEPVPALTSKNHQSGLVSVSKIRIAIESDFWNRDQNLVFINDRMNLFCVGSYQNCNTIFFFQI